MKSHNLSTSEMPPEILEILDELRKTRKRTSRLLKQIEDLAVKAREIIIAHADELELTGL